MAAQKCRSWGKHLFPSCAFSHEMNEDDMVAELAHVRRT